MCVYIHICITYYHINWWFLPNGECPTDFKNVIYLVEYDYFLFELQIPIVLCEHYCIIVSSDSGQKWALHYNILLIKKTCSKSHYCLNERKEDVMNKNRSRKANDTKMRFLL